jgi:serine/threonine-protein kinase
MISNEGRVCVTDFGLVRPLDCNDVNTGCVSVTGDQSLELATVTRTGAVMGTPAYMAPEQLLGEDIDARGDQFSFCVALWEALFGELPFLGKSFAELRHRKISGQVRTPPKDRQVPSWLRNVVLKGLSKQPADRFGSMTELLAALAHAPGKRLRARLVTAGAVCIVALAVAVTVYGIVGRGVRCEVPPDEFAGVWDSTVRQQIRSAFHASDVPHAGDVFTRFERNLDTYISAWTSAFLESCRDTHERRLYSQDVLSLRVSCLRNRRDVVRALTSNLSHDVDRSVIGRAVETALQLPLLSRCLAIDSPEDSTEQPRGQAGTQALPRDLANVEILDDLGKYADGLRAAQRILLRGKQLSHMPTIAAGLFWVGRHQEGMGDYKNSEESLRNAARIAAYVGDTQLYARASLDLAWTIGVRHGRVDEASAMFSFLNEEAFAAALDEPVLLTHYLQVVGLIHLAKGNYTGARDHLTKALSIQESILGPEHPALVKTLHNLGYIHAEQNRLDEAYTYYQRALSLAEKVLGPEHFLVGNELVSLGGILVKQGEFDRARPLLTRGLAIEQQELGPSHPFLAGVFSDLGEISLNDRDYDQARGHFQRALVIALDGAGAKSTNAGRAYAGLARTSTAQGRLSDARTHYEHAVEALRTKPHEQRRLAEAQFGLARMLVSSQSDFDRAFSLAQKAREYFADTGDPIARAKLAEIERWSHVAGN